MVASTSAWVLEELKQRPSQLLVDIAWKNKILVILTDQDLLLFVTVAYITQSNLTYIFSVN